MLLAFLTAVALPLSATTARSASCLSRSDALGALRAQLGQLGYSGSETSYLVATADALTAPLPASRLTARAKACGIDTARANIFDCTRSLLSGTVRSMRGKPDQMRPTPKGLEGWNKAQHTAREFAFIGAFEGCFEAAKAMFD